MFAQLENLNIDSPHHVPYQLEGLVHVFTSSHRNFFTDVMAQSLRIASQGTAVLIVQFLKGGINQGHQKPIQLVKNLDWIRCDLPRCIDTPHLDDTETQSLQKLWQHTQKVVIENKYSLVVLDELSLAINFGLIPETEVLSLITQRPPHVDIILTGSDTPKSILDIAEQITEVRRSYD